MTLAELIKWCDSRGITFEFCYDYCHLEHRQMVLIFKDVLHNYKARVEIEHCPEFWKELEEVWLPILDEHRIKYDRIEPIRFIQK